MRKRDWRRLSWLLMAGSILAVLASGWGFVYADFWLASTQWLLVGGVLAVWALYARLES